MWRRSSCYDQGVFAVYANNDTSVLAVPAAAHPQRRRSRRPRGARETRFGSDSRRPRSSGDLEREVTRALDSGDESALRVLGYGEISAVLAVEETLALAEAHAPLLGAAALDAYRVTLETYSPRSGRPAPRSSTHELIHHAPEARSPTSCSRCSSPQSLAPARPRGRREADALFEELVARCRHGHTAPRPRRPALQLGRARRPGALPRRDHAADARRRAAANGSTSSCSSARCPGRCAAWCGASCCRASSTSTTSRAACCSTWPATSTRKAWSALIAPLLSRANAHVSPAITAPEVKRYYADDARTWALLQRLRRVDRAWQRHIRRRSYAFLLPGAVERRV